MIGPVMAVGLSVWAHFVVQRHQFMVGDSAKRILERLRNSGLMSGEQIPVLESFAQSGDDTEARASERLIEHGLLTPIFT